MTGQLAAVINRLFEQSRSDGRNRAETLSNGLKLTVSTYPDEFMALSRNTGPPSMDEAATVAREAGWQWFSTEWQPHRGTQYLVIRLEYSQDDEMQATELSAPEPAPPEPAPDSAGEPTAEFVQALLEHPGPWRTEAITLRGDLTSYLAGARRSQLLDMHEWIKNRFPDDYRKFQQQHLRSALF